MIMINCAAIKYENAEDKNNITTIERIMMACLSISDIIL